jgi:hypothetical protein
VFVSRRIVTKVETHCAHKAKKTMIEQAVAKV